MDIKPVATNLITDLGNNRPVQTGPTEDQAKSQAAGTNTASTPPADLSLTEAARNLLDIQAAMEKIDDVDTAKVDAIRQAIEEGSYEIDTANLADNLIKSGLDLP